MTELLNKAFSAASELTPAMQDEIARLVLTYVGDDLGSYRFTQEEDAAQDEADLEEARGDYASDEEIQSIWKKHGL